jgi:hypothetical protein
MAVATEMGALIDHQAAVACLERQPGKGGSVEPSSNDQIVVIRSGHGKLKLAQIVAAVLHSSTTPAIRPASRAALQAESASLCSREVSTEATGDIIWPKATLATSYPHPPPEKEKMLKP